MIQSMQAILPKYILPVSVISFLVASVLFTSQVLAIGRPNGVGQNGSQNRKLNQNSMSTENTDDVSSASGSAQRGNSSSHMPSFAQVRLQDAKLKVCEKMSENITRRSVHLVDLVTRMEKTFTSIAQGVEQYYLTKVVPAGNTLSNYDTLVADIATKQSAVDSMVATAQSGAAAFSCTGNNPKAQLTQYRTDMQAVIKGLQDYRTSIKNLIVAVRTLKSTSLFVTPSASLSATLTPTETLTPTGIPSVTP